MSHSIDVEGLRHIIREEVRRAFLEVLIELLPEVNEEEQREIEEKAGKPIEYSREEFMEWSGS